MSIRAGLVGAKDAEKLAPPLSFPKPGHCYYMFGDFGKPGFHWCGKLCRPGSSYCPDHRTKIYTDPKTKKSADSVETPAPGDGVVEVEEEPADAELAA